MMRISREDESYIGRARTNMTGRTRIGFAKDGRITALDLFIVQDNGCVRADGRSPVCRSRRVDHLPAAGDAVARDQRADQHAAAVAAAVARPDAGQRDDRADHHQGCEAARHRSGRDPEDQLAGGQGDVRTRAAERPASAPDERVRQRSARSAASRRLQVGRAQGAHRASAADRRYAASASPSGRTAPDRSASTA